MADTEVKVEDDVLIGEEEGNDEVCYIDIVFGNGANLCFRRRSQR